MDGRQHMTREMLEYEFNNQADAVARVLTLFSDQKLSLSDVTQKLAEAERRAKFVCGFIDLDDRNEEKNELENRLIERGIIVRHNDGSISLTPLGEKRSAIKLPEPIEARLRS